MADDFSRFRVGYLARIGAELPLDRFDEERVTIQLRPKDTWLLEMSPWVARDLAKRLKKAADLLDPPKPRKKA